MQQMPQVQQLSRRAWEVVGLLRPELSCAADLAEVDEQLARALDFLVETLPQAAEQLDVHPLGLVFQSLLLRAGAGRGTQGPGERPSLARLDAALGQATADRLAARARDLCGLLRVKVEDDGDLALARRVLEDCRRFFRILAILAERHSTGTWEVLQEALAAGEA